MSSSEKTIQSFGSFLSQIRQYFVLKKQANYWFGGLLAIAQEVSYELVQDLKCDQCQELCLILNNAFVSIFSFNMPEMPSSVYKLLSIYRECLCNDYGQSNSGRMSKITYLNNLAIFSLKTKDYNTTIISFEQILSLYNQGTFENSLQLLLISLSNFLLLLKKDISCNQITSVRSSSHMKSSHKNFSQFKEKLQNHLKDLFTKQLNKMHKKLSEIKSLKNKTFSSLPDDQQYHLLLGIYHQHQQTLKVYQENIIFLDKSFKDLQQKVNNLLTKQALPHKKLYQEKIYKKIISKVQLRKFQLHFHFSSNIDQIYKQKQFGSLTTRNNGSKLNKIQKLIEESVSLMRQQQFKDKLFQTIQPNRSINNEFMNSRYKRLTNIKPIQQSFNKPNLKRINSKIIQSDQSNISDNSIRQEYVNKEGIQPDQQQKKVQKQQLTIIQEQPKQNQTKSNLIKQNLTKPQEQNSDKFLNQSQVDTNTKKQNRFKKFLPKFQTFRLGPPRTSTIGRPSLLANYEPRKRQIKIQKKQIQPFILDLSKQINFKHNGIQMAFTQQGLLLADYSRAHSRYLEWNFVVNIISKIKDLSLLSICTMLPLSNFYDVARLLQPYVSRADNGQLKISKLCKPLLQLNYSLTKLFLSDGPYLKIIQMNSYDPNRLEGSIDCFFQEYDAIFRTVYHDDFLRKLNQLFCCSQKFGKKGGISESRGVRDNYHLPMKRHKNQNAVNQLRQLISNEVIQQCLRGQGDYKIILYMKNRNNLLFKIKIKADEQSEQYFQLSVTGIQIQTLHFDTEYNKSQQKSQMKRIITMPMSLVNKYIPLELEANLKNYLTKYGKIIFQLFGGISIDDQALEINEKIEIYQTKSSMIPYGKYYTPISIQIFGDGRRVIGIIFREYQLAFGSEKIALFLNPYSDFLSDFGTQSVQVKKEVLQKMLVQGNLISTYNWLKKQNLFESVRSMNQYLIRIGLLL